MGALDGVRVLDLSRLLPGGYLTMVLADHGAQVTKVEQPGTGDGLRTTPPLTATGEGALHVTLGRGKRSVALDLRSAAGRTALLELVAGADVLVESFRPGVMERLGLGWEVLAARNPALVLVSLTGEGARSRRALHDLNAQAEAGALLLAAPTGGGPAPPATQVADLGAALHAAVGTLAALRHTAATGQGQRVEVSMADAALSLLPVATAAVGVSGAAPEPGGDALTGGLACYGTYRCADDRWLAVAALEPAFFARLVALLGTTGLDGDDPPEPTGQPDAPGADLLAWQYDPGRQDALRARLAAVFARRDRDAWLELLGEDDTCVTAVRDVAEAMALGRARGAVITTTAPGGVRLDQVAPPARLSATPARAGAHPSRLGADGGTGAAVGGGT